MRKNIFRFAVSVAFISAFVACSKNNDTTPNSGAQTLDRDKFLGVWHVTSHHTVTSVTQFWDMTVVSGSSETEVLMDNFDQIGSTHFVTASVSGSLFTVPQQSAGSPAETIKGSGTYSNGNLTFNYTADDGQQVDTVSATAHK